jgi:hypothetical protein
MRERAENLICEGHFSGKGGGDRGEGEGGDYFVLQSAID